MKFAFEAAEIDQAICVWDPYEELEPLIPSFISSSSSAYVTLTKSENLWWIDLDFNLPLPEKKSPSKSNASGGIKGRAMDLDQWISKVKDGQHLSEDELQRLCEYVRAPYLLLLPLLPYLL